MGTMNETTDQSDEPEDKDDPHSESALLAQVKRHKKESDQHLGTWREDARLAYSFKAGEHWNETEKAELEANLRLPVVFNRVDPMVEAVGGSEINNRQQVQYVPRQVGDSGVNEILTGAADYFRDNCDAEDEESDAFMDVVICGVGVTETYLDYVENPEGMVVTDRRDPLSMRWDPAAKKRNLTDKKWVQREEWQDVSEIKQKWPEKADDIEASTSEGWSDEDGKQHDQSLAFLYEKDNTGTDPKTGKRRVIHEQWFELETYHTLLDPMTGEMTEMDDEKFQVLKPRLKKLGMSLQSVKKQRKKWHQVFVCGDVVLEHSEVACNESSYKFITGRRDRNNNTWYGLVKAMIDPQKWANKFFSQFLHIINTNAKGGLIIEEGVTDNLTKFKRDWSKSDSVTVVNEGGMGKLMPKPPPVIPPQMSQMMEFSISSLRDVSGLNLEILGMADRQQAGVLEAQRKQAALTVLAGMFDGLRRYRKEQGRLLAKYITEYLSDGRLVRILGGDGTEKYIPLFRQEGSMEYDVIVDESANTMNQKDKTFAILMQLMPVLEKQGVPFQPELLEYTPLPAAMVQKWKDMIKQREEQAKQNPPPPPPQMISAQANMIRANAAMLAVQSKGQGDQMKAQSDGMKMQGQQMQMMREAEMQPYEQQLKMMELSLQERELELQARELEVRDREAQAAAIQSVADSRTAQMESLGFKNPR